MMVLAFDSMSEGRLDVVWSESCFALWVKAQHWPVRLKLK